MRFTCQYSLSCKNLYTVQAHKIHYIQRNLSESSMGTALAKAHRHAVIDLFEKKHFPTCLFFHEFVFSSLPLTFPGIIFKYLFSNTINLTDLSWTKSCFMSHCPIWWCGKENQSMTKLLDAPTHHLTLWFSHTFMPTSPWVNCCQLTELGCDVHHCAASSLPPVS